MFCDVSNRYMSFLSKTLRLSLRSLQWGEVGAHDNLAHWTVGEKEIHPPGHPRHLEAHDISMTWVNEEKSHTWITVKSKLSIFDPSDLLRWQCP